jgi:PTS system nitrogen regulatory IIA component
MTNEILTLDRIVFLEETEKEAALKKLAENLGTAPQVKDRNELCAEILSRDALLSTAIGCGIAIPHVRLASVTDLVMSVGLSRVDIQGFEAIDGAPVRLLFMIAAAQNQHTYYLQTLASFCTLLKEKTLRDGLLSARTADEVYRLLSQRV